MDSESDSYAESDQDDYEEFPSYYKDMKIPWLKYEPEPECHSEIWDNDCVVLDAKPSTELIQGYHLITTCDPQPLEVKKKKLCVQLNDKYSNEEFLLNFKDHFKNNNALKDSECEIVQNPWKVAVLENVIQEKSILELARREFYEVPWNQRRMDLYEFYQSEDLKKLDSCNIDVIFEFLKKDLKAWVENLTDFEFTHVSATCSFYGDSDFLLVHDDQCDDRAVAFVLYLSELDWKTEWGGALQLFDRDADGQPVKCTREIYPKNNQLVLFPVSERSYHQVDEVRYKNSCRFSINGWFHVKEPLKFETPIYKAPTGGIHSKIFNTPIEISCDLEAWIQSTWLNEKTLLNEDSSSAECEYFINDTILNQLQDFLKTEDLEWKTMGPPNRRNYQYLSNLPDLLLNFVNIFRSVAFFGYLEDKTELELTKMQWEFQKWTPGSYSLIEEVPGNQLDLRFCIAENYDIIGANTNYITMEDEVQTPLATLDVHEENILQLTYGDTARYTSYMTHNNKTKCLYIFVASYFEE